MPGHHFRERLLEVLCFSLVFLVASAPCLATSAVQAFAVPVAAVYRPLYSRTSTFVNRHRTIFGNDSDRTLLSIAVVGSGFSSEPLFINITHTREWLPLAPLNNSDVGLPVKSR